MNDGGEVQVIPPHGTESAWTVKWRWTTFWYDAYFYKEELAREFAGRILEAGR